MSYEPVLKSIRCLNDVFLHSLRSGAPTVEQPSDIKVALRPHQKAILYDMEHHEVQLSKGMDVSGARLYSRFAILGDSVGVGKSLMVLGHIARLKYLQTLALIPTLDAHSSSQIYSLYDGYFPPNQREIGSLIVVPHTLYRQWRRG